MFELNEIKNLFLGLIPNRKVEKENSQLEYSSIIFTTEDEFGVMIYYSGDCVIHEKFHLISLETAFVFNKKVLKLSSHNRAYLHEFAIICYDFLDYGPNYTKRDDLLNNPYNWFEKWKDLVGNIKSNMRTYDVLGEMLTLLYLFQQGYKPVWNSINKGTHDIDTFDGGYEVKSTTIRTHKTITINSIYQLKADNSLPLRIAYCVFEKGIHGVSIDDLLQKLSSYASVDNYNEHLSNMGYEKGKKERIEKYVLRSIDLFDVDDDFPKILPESFANGTFPRGVLSIQYTIDLTNILSKQVVINDL